MNQVCSSSISEQTYRSTSPTGRISMKNETNNKKHDTIIAAEKFLQKENKREGGDGKLMPVSSKIKFETS